MKLAELTQEALHAGHEVYKKRFALVQDEFSEFGAHGGLFGDNVLEKEYNFLAGKVNAFEEEIQKRSVVRRNSFANIHIARVFPDRSEIFANAF